jgi:hypothetical protein
MTFWLIALLIVFLMMRRRHWGSWESHGWGSGRFGRANPAALGALERELEAQRDYVASLETRVLELEERLDFTERLLAGRQEASAGA